MRPHWHSAMYSILEFTWNFSSNNTLNTIHSTIFLSISPVDYGVYNFFPSTFISYTSFFFFLFHFLGLYATDRCDDAFHFMVENLHTTMCVIHSQLLYLSKLKSDDSGPFGVRANHFFSGQLWLTDAKQKCNILFRIEKTFSAFHFTCIFFHWHFVHFLIAHFYFFLFRGKKFC